VRDLLQATGVVLVIIVFVKLSVDRHIRLCIEVEIAWSAAMSAAMKLKKASRTPEEKAATSAAMSAAMKL